MKTQIRFWEKGKKNYQWMWWIWCIIWSLRWIWQSNCEKKEMWRERSYNHKRIEKQSYRRERAWEKRERDSVREEKERERAYWKESRSRVWLREGGIDCFIENTTVKQSLVKYGIFLVGFPLTKVCFRLTIFYNAIKHRKTCFTSKQTEPKTIVPYSRSEAIQNCPKKFTCKTKRKIN